MKHSAYTLKCKRLVKCVRKRQIKDTCKRANTLYNYLKIKGLLDRLMILE